jgi:glutathione S-transferase
MQNFVPTQSAKHRPQGRTQLRRKQETTVGTVRYSWGEMLGSLSYPLRGIARRPLLWLGRCRGLASASSAGDSSSLPPTATPPLYRLIYFDSRGAAELTRYLLAVCAVPYDDLRYPLHATAQGFGVSTTTTTSSADGPDFLRDQAAGAFAVNRGQLPVLQVLTPDGRAAVATLGQSHAINRFLAERHAWFGSTAVERAQMDALYESVRDIRSDFLRAKRKSPTAQWIQERLPEHCQRLEASLPRLPSVVAGGGAESSPPDSSPWLTGTAQPSLADVALYALLGTATSPVSGSLVGALDNADPTSAYSKGNTDCPRLARSVRAFQALPAVQSWEATRPDTFS